MSDVFPCIFVLIQICFNIYLLSLVACFSLAAHVKHFSVNFSYIDTDVAHNKKKTSLNTKT